MPEIEIVGNIRNYDLTYYYTQKVLETLGLKRLRNREVTIHFKQKIKGGVFLGLCEGDKDSCYVQIAKVEPNFGMRLSYMQMMKTLTHELVHVKQFMRGELTSVGEWIWKGRAAEGYSYENQPWEKEAYKLQEEIFDKVFPIDLEFIN